MTRDDDLIREILFDFEKSEDWLIPIQHTMGMTQEARVHFGHVNLLCDAGLVTRVGKGTFRLTNSGHDYLSAIRSDTIWKKTKEGSAKLAGVSLGMLFEIATAYVKQEAAEKLGIEL